MINNLQVAFKSGYKRFFEGYAEYDIPEKFSYLANKEFLRGWNKAYFDNLKELLKNEKAEEKKFSSSIDTN